MRTTPTPTGRHWDGSRRPTRRPRPLQVAGTSPSRLLRTGQSGRCRQCGNRIDLYQRADQRPIALHPTELATPHVPESCRWHLSSGIAYPHGDGSPWCRIPHAVLCPRRTPLCRTGPHLDALRRQLAVHTRRLTDTGAFAPEPAPATTQAADSDADNPARPVVQMLLCRYLAENTIEHIRCVAQTRHRRRCTHPVLAPTAPAGVWRLMPTGSHRGQLALPNVLMAVYDLNHLPYSEQLRWRAQRCPQHAAAPGAADLALAGWQPFDPLLHAAHIRTRMPHPPGRHLKGR
ncbi:MULTISPECIES: DUF6083 domain-containing protein [Streptomyces]|uniref:Uncharacterized protein n=1 Tax=Streptomyces chartreusis NRRL 3882 TaxID=1079985 RepID=A0A2N9AZR6_STRCX|nr:MULTISPECIES: DUF6083 domain-containing protein [Streptomyces]MYS95632.1 hypothetical protein [Streptomyces sp. SID5464]SOR76560.1 hypothetical protein SCNRRL3882_0044 [Streptomyces chartreusis NRRL 3882]